MRVGKEYVPVATKRLGWSKRDGVSVEDCARVSRDLGVLLDAENVMEDDSYTLEVSSPGLDRPFKRLMEFIPAFLEVFFCLFSPADVAKNKHVAARILAGIIQGHERFLDRE